MTGPDPLVLRVARVGEAWDNTEVPTQVGPVGARTPNTGPGRPTKEVDVATSLPYPPMPAHGTPENYLKRMSRVDGCPSCVENAETPSSVHDNHPHGWLANYVCIHCGHAWTTSWGDC